MHQGKISWKKAVHSFALVHWRNRTRQFVTLLLFGLLSTLSCAWAQAPASVQPPFFNASPPTLPLMHAVVKRVLRETGEVVLDHRDLPNLRMLSMTMEFEVSRKEMLQAFEAGNKVRFQAEIIAEKPTITVLERAP